MRDRARTGGDAGFSAEGARPLRPAKMQGTFGARHRILAVDLGSKRVGLALSDPTGKIAQPLDTIEASPQETLAERVAEIAKKHEVKQIVVGLPRRLDGTSGPEAKAARAMADEIRKWSGTRVELVDERLTTAQAERSMIAGGVRRSRRKASIDQVAATLLLQSHLDRQG